MVVKLRPVSKLCARVVIFIGIILVFYNIAFQNYLLFHVVTELCSIIIGFTIFVITKNTHKVAQNNYFMFLGISFLIISGFDMIHILTFDGMNIISGTSLNLSIQFRVTARVLQAISFLVFALMIKRQDKPVKLRNLLNLYYTFSVLLFLAIAGGVFPKLYIEAKGFTGAKFIIEILIVVLLIAVIASLIKNKKGLYENISLYLIASLVVFALSEICFSTYIRSQDVINITGHNFKLIGYYLIYKAIIQTTLENPYNVLFYRLTEINSSLEIKTRLLMKINEKLNDEISERKCIEEKLRESKRNYQALLDFLPYAIIVHSFRKIMYVNNAAIKLLKLRDYKEILDTDVMEFVHPDSYSMCEERMSRVYQNEVTELTEMKFVASDGSIIDVETMDVPYKFKDKQSNLVVIGDISARKKAQEKEKALKEAMDYDRIKNEFMANISHELRTPLNVIFGTAQIIELYSQNDTICENKKNIARYSKSLKQNCYRMLRLVNNLIDLTKIDSGFLKLNIQNHNIVSVVEDVTLSVAEYIESKNINIQFDTDVEEKYSAFDTDAIERIMLNLLSNAVKFTPEDGSILVNISDKEEYILISVKDSGIGIPDEMLEVIFDRFRQVDKSLARNTEGSGIGLNLVKSLVELQGGEISVKSKCGEGSEFIVKLPVAEVPYDEVAATQDIPQGKVERIHIEFSDIYSQ